MEVIIITMDIKYESHALNTGVIRTSANFAKGSHYCLTSVNTRSAMLLIAYCFQISASSDLSLYSAIDDLRFLGQVTIPLLRLWISKSF